MKFLTLFQSLKGILSLLKKKKPSQKSSDTQRDWRQSEFVGICVGHSRPKDFGATNYNNTTTEWSYNSKVARAVERALNVKGIRSKVYASYQGNTYGAAMRYIKRILREDGATLALELHYNSYNHVVRGTETWYSGRLKDSKELASRLQNSIINAYGSRSRGIKEAKRGGRGFAFLDAPDRPTVLCEPFFGDNKKDFLLFAKPEELGQPIADGIENFLLDKHTSNLSARKDNATE